MLNEGLDELLAQAGQAVAVQAGKALLLGLWGKLLPLHGQEVEVGWEGAEEVQDVVAPVVADDALALHGGAELHRLVLLVQHVVPLDLRRGRNGEAHDLARQNGQKEAVPLRMQLIL